MSNVASEMGYVVLIPLAGVVFHALGRHPLAGMAAAFQVEIKVEIRDIFSVLVNHEEQYSIWPDYKVLPEGWRAVGQQGDKAQCLAWMSRIFQCGFCERTAMAIFTLCRESLPGPSPNSG